LWRVSAAVSGISRAARAETPGAAPPARARPPRISDRAHRRPGHGESMALSPSRRVSRPAPWRRGQPRFLSQAHISDAAHRRLPAPSRRDRADDAGRHFRVRPEAFVQVNVRQRHVLYERAVAFAQLTGGERAVDAYAGIGMLTARLAERAAGVIAVEESPYAVRLGELNMQLNGCGNVHYRRGRLEDTVRHLDESVDVLVLDPPRAGCTEAAVEAMATLRAERI